MRHFLRSTRFAGLSALAVSVGALLSAGSALATENLYGGGSTFAAPPYVGNDYLLTLPNEARLSTDAGNTAGAMYNTADISAGSFFAKYNSVTGNNISYCQTGSGFGKNSLNGSLTALANGQCNDYSTSPVGLSAPTISPDYIGTDAPYSTADYNNFLAGSQLATHAGILQIPTIAGAIAMSHNSTVSNVALYTSAVCKIYSGVITKWPSVKNATSTSTAPIKIIYRTDSSGTTFAFTTWLANNCNGTANVPTGFVFTPNSTFNSAIPGGVTAVYGTRSLGEMGNPGVVGATIDPSNPNALGYADIGEVINESAPYGTMNGFDPTQFGISGGVPTPISISSSNLKSGYTLDGSTANPAPGSSSQAIKNCLRLVSPTVKISSTYPIVAVTYVDGYYSGNGTAAHVAAIKGLYDLYYDHTNRPVLPTGYAYLDGVATFATVVKNTVNSCVKS